MKIKTGFQKIHLTKIKQVIDKAIKISKVNRKAYIQYKEFIEEDTNAITEWPLKYLFRTPIIKLSKQLLDQDTDRIGITLTHELIHCRQGFWMILTQNIWWTITRKPGFPPFEQEAYDSINDWYNYGKSRN